MTNEGVHRRLYCSTDYIHAHHLFDTREREVRGVFVLPNKEKTPRAGQMPGIPVDGRTGFVLTWFVYYIRRARMGVLRKRSILFHSQGPLFFHSATGAGLNRHQVMSPVKSSFANATGQQRVTPLVLRRSFATNLRSHFRAGRGWRGMTEDEFLSQLARFMNTSREQLINTYLADSQYEAIKSARKFLDAGNLGLDDFMIDAYSEVIPEEAPDKEYNIYG